jgi:bifunctional enzyme CysN/CysC
MSELELIEKDIHEYLARQERKDLLRLLTAGSVDDGKSTLIGRLLHDSQMIYEDQLAAMKKDSEKRGFSGAEVDYSLLVDGLLSEREQGITIDVAYRYFSTERRKFIIADTPGHEQYTRNMATGASTADLAIILIDARYGVLAQTKRHSFIASLLGIKHIVVTVNKMDLMGYSQEVFDKIKRDYVDFATKLGVSDIHFMPISALRGDNVVERSANMPWYDGQPLLSYLETVHIASDRNFIDLRFPVQYVSRPNLDFRGFAGTIASGVIRRGDEIMALPSGRKSRVKSIVTWEGELDEAFPPQAVNVTLEDEIDVSRGDMLVRPDNLPHIARTFEAMLVWMSDEPMRAGKSYLIKQTTAQAPGEISDVRYKLDVNTLRSQPATELKLNEIGRVAMTTSRPLLFDAYAKNRATGAFIVIDRLTNGTVGAGMILDRGPAELVSTHATRGGEAGDVKPKRSLVTPDERAKRLAQRPVTVWLTGLPKSGKSRVAYALEKKLFDDGYTAHVIDGENMRLTISHDLGFSATDRAENSRRAAEIARLTNGLGLITIAGFISPYAAHRAEAKKIIGDDRFFEVYLSAPIDACEARDDAGLYAKAKAGELPYFSGVTAPYEAPEQPDLVLPTHEISVDESVTRILAALRGRGFVR